MTAQRPPVAASVPGKLILAGEHAAVYGRPALVAAIGRRARVEVAPGGEGVLLRLPDLGRETRTGWAAIGARTAAARRRWERAAGGVETPAVVGGDDPAGLVEIALGEVAGDLGSADLPPIELRVVSGIPVGSGFGSSAAIGVGVVAALLAFLGEEPEMGRIDRLATEIERRQHGRPSGVDHRTVLAGGVVAARRREGGLTVEPVECRSPLLARLEVFDSGRPPETTGAVVGAVARRREREPERVDGLFDRMGRGVEALRRELEAEVEEPARVCGLIREQEECLERLGVVPAAVRTAVRAVEEGGGAAKISGAGALSGPGAGCLLVYRPPGVEAVWTPAVTAWERHELELGVEGLRLEGGP